MLNKDEGALVALAKLKNKAAFTELVRRNQSAVRSLLRRLSGDAVLANDLSQQVFITVWVGIESLGSLETFQGWLRQIAVNTWLKNFRKREPLKRAEDVEDVAIAAPHTSISERIDINTALAKLPREVRLCVVLCYHEGMSHNMIAEVTGIKLGTIKSHILRGSKILRELLSAYDTSQ